MIRSHLFATRRPWSAVALTLLALAPANAADDKDGRFDKFTISPTFGIRSVAASPDGKQFVFALGDATLRIWDAEKAEEVRQWSAHDHPAIHRVAFSPDGKHIFSCSEDGTVRQWEAASGKKVREFEGHPVGVKWVEVSPDGKRLLTCGYDAQLRLVEIENGKLQHAMRITDGFVESPFICASFSPKDERALAGNSKGHVSLWDLKNGKQVNLYSVEKGLPTAVAYLPDGKSFVSADGNDGTIRVWSISAVKVTQTFQGHTGAVTSLALSPDGTMLVSGGADKSLRVWDLNAGKEIRKLEEHTKAVTHVAFAAGGRIISGGEDGAIIIWQLPK